MLEAIKFYDTVHLTLSEKLALKTPNVLIKKWLFSSLLSFFLERLTKSDLFYFFYFYLDRSSDNDRDCYHELYLYRYRDRYHIRYREFYKKR
jgi:hypothetical protein